MVLGGFSAADSELLTKESLPTPFPSPNRVMAQRHQFGIAFLRYAQGDRERVTDLVEGPPLHKEPV